MKNLKLTLFSIAFTAIFFIPKNSIAQIDTRIGGMLAYGTEIKNIGFGVNAEFGIMEKLSISPSFIYYLPKTEGPVKINWFEFNANANYYFLADQEFDFYGLAGLNYSSVKVKYDGGFGGMFGGGSASTSDGRLGLNLGAGANFNLNGITPFAEIKYVIIDGGQLVLAAGVKFNI